MKQRVLSYDHFKPRVNNHWSELGRNGVYLCAVFTNTPIGTVGYASFVPPKIGVVRDEICTTQGPKVDCVRQVDF